MLLWQPAHSSHAQQVAAGASEAEEKEAAKSLQQVDMQISLPSNAETCVVGHNQEQEHETVGHESLLRNQFITCLFCSLE